MASNCGLQQLGQHTLRLEQVWKRVFTHKEGDFRPVKQLHTKQASKKQFWNEANLSAWWKGGCKRLEIISGTQPCMMTSQAKRGAQTRIAKAPTSMRRPVLGESPSGQMHNLQTRA